MVVAAEETVEVADSSGCTPVHNDPHRGLCVRIEPRREGASGEMTYYPDFDPYSVRERNEGLRREVSTYRLQKQLRQNREPRSGLSNLTASRGFSRSSWRVFVIGGR